ncbi:HIG1 domain-containing protein [Hyphomicrobium sp.]|uniref:HIG1 domain-containing protein n=1 Tax=Hyphomicrobium sp. TaxID=82 RepID=UPI002FDCA895
MGNLISFLIALLIVLLVGTLAMRAWNAASGATDDTSQKVMRWRVSLQLAAILALGALFALHHYSS